MTSKRLRRARSALALAFLVAGGPSWACLPPPPGWVPPTEEQRVRDAAGWATDIVYGVVLRGSGGRRHARFRVLHVYKGSLTPGAVLDAEPGWGLNPPICAGMLGGPPPVSRGAFGVIAFRSDQPALNFVGDRELELMFSEGLIRSAGADAMSDRNPR